MTAVATPAVAPCRVRRPANLTHRLRWVLALTLAFMVVEAVGGWLSGSLALVADAGHMLADVAALALALFSAWLADRPASATKTFGYLRSEVLAALVNGAALLALAAWVAYEAVARVRAPHAIDGPLFLGVAVAGLAVNGVAAVLLHGQHRHDLNTRAAYWHVLGDLLGSVGAVAAAVVVWLTGWTRADALISLVLAALILVGAWRLVRESVDVLLEAVPAHLSLPEVQARILAIPGVAAVHDLHVWTVTSGIVAMSGHVHVPDLARHPAVLAAVREAMAGLGIGHVTVQLEVADGCEPGLVAASPPAHPGCAHAH